MRGKAVLFSALVSTLLGIPSVGAETLDGVWMGSFRGLGQQVFVQLWLGGEDDVPSGRIELPVFGGHFPLKKLRMGHGEVSFLVAVGPNGVVRFEARARDGRLEGHVHAGRGWGRLEMIRVLPTPAPMFAPLAGSYEFREGEDDAVLVYSSPDGPAYVEHATGRTGRLFAIDHDVFVSGQTILSGYPIDLRVRFERDGAGIAQAVTWRREGQPDRRAVRRDHYRAEDVAFVNGEVRLAGTLLVPNGPGRFPGVVMIQGSGGTPRSSLMPLADAMARHGVAVLLHDKRGTGRSTGASRASFADLAGDALAGVALLKSTPAVDPARIGLHGMSLGGWVAPLAASRSTDVRFVILEAAPAVSPAEHERLRVQNQMIADGVRPPLVMNALAFLQMKFDVGRTGRDWPRLQRLQDRGRQEGWLHYTNGVRTLEDLRWAWAHIWTYDPVPALERLRVPVLAIYGEWDATVSPDVNRAHLERALARAGNHELTVRVFSKANHHFLLSVTGAPREVDLLTRFVPGYVDARASWLTEGPIARTAGRSQAIGAATVADGRAVLNGSRAPWHFPRPRP